MQHDMISSQIIEDFILYYHWENLKRIKSLAIKIR